jgi:DNA/RNA-binding domain of Phe-tRNA-synthetase-like protein
MPVYRDAVGGIGTPTSDNERTKMSLQTTRILAIVNGYDGNAETVSDTARMIVDLVTRYCDAKDVSWVLF